MNVTVSVHSYRLLGKGGRVIPKKQGTGDERYDIKLSVFTEFLSYLSQHCFNFQLFERCVDWPKIIRDRPLIISGHVG